MLRHADWRNTVTMAHAWGWHGSAGRKLARPAKWSAEQTRRRFSNTQHAARGCRSVDEYDRRHERAAGETGPTSAQLHRFVTQ